MDTIVTLRLTHDDRQLLDELVALRGEDLRAEGLSPTVASYLRGLIRREAAAKGLLVSARRPSRVLKKA